MSKEKNAQIKKTLAETKERRNPMQVEDKTYGKYSIKKKAKSCSLKLEAHPL